MRRNRRAVRGERHARSLHACRRRVARRRTWVNRARTERGVRARCLGRGALLGSARCQTPRNGPEETSGGARSRCQERGVRRLVMGQRNASGEPPRSRCRPGARFQERGVREPRHGRPESSRGAGEERGVRERRCQTPRHGDPQGRRRFARAGCSGPAELPIISRIGRGTSSGCLVDTWGPPQGHLRRSPTRCLSRGRVTPGSTRRAGRQPASRAEVGRCARQRCVGRGCAPEARDTRRLLGCRAVMLEPAAPTGSDTPTYTRNRAKRRAIIASIITGTTIEWYDFTSSGGCSRRCMPHFFPDQQSGLRVG